MSLCQDGNFREARYFQAWSRRGAAEDHFLPAQIRSLTGQKTVPFGDAVLETLDTVIGCESCEEL